MAKRERKQIKKVKHTHEHNISKYGIKHYILNTEM